MSLLTRTQILRSAPQVTQSFFFLINCELSQKAPRTFNALSVTCTYISSRNASTGELLQLAACSTRHQLRKKKKRNDLKKLEMRKPFTIYLLVWRIRSDGVETGDGAHKHPHKASLPYFLVVRLETLNPLNTFSSTRCTEF